MNRNGENIANLVKTIFYAYQSKDRSIIEPLLSDNFLFTSPHDYRIDKLSYFKRCWPFNEKVKAYHFIKIIEQDNQAFVLYECEEISGKKFRNTEFFTVEDGKIREIEVFYGSLPDEVKEFWEKRDKKADLSI